MYFSLRRTGHRHRSHSVNTRQGVGNAFVENLIQARQTLFCFSRDEHDRNHIGAKLKDNRGFGIIGQIVRHHIQFITHIVGEHVDIVAILKFKGDNGNVFLRITGDMLEVLHRVERVFKRSRHILFDILGARTRISGHHHNGVGIDIGIEVDRQF